MQGCRRHQQKFELQLVSYKKYDESLTVIDFHWEMTHLNAIGQFFELVRDATLLSSCMRPLRVDEQFIVFTSGEEYDGYEKLLLPFDEQT